MRPKLDVKKIIEPILRNYDEHVLEFIELLGTISCTLVYDGPAHVRQHILDKTVYACSVKYWRGKKPKILKNIFPIMIGSRLDLLIRKSKIYQISKERLLSPPDEDASFDPVEIIITSFIICGSARQLPYFFTNDPTNMHVIKNSIVRCYSYDKDDRGKELSLYVDSVDEKHSRGDLFVTLNDGTETADVEGFFSHCAYSTEQVAYMLKVYNRGVFDVDKFDNKLIISPCHLLVRLFVKYLYLPLRDGRWEVAKSKANMVIKSIETGELLHVLSRKTLYFKETGSKPKMVPGPRENHREIGMNGEIYVEKNTGCYREISQQTYPLNPYLSHLIVRQMSSKVKTGSIIPFHASYLNFLCIFGTLETKNIGRTNIMVRDTYVSTCYDMEPVFRAEPGKKLYAELNLETEPRSCYHVVVNEACVPVTEKCFRRIDLARLKRLFTYIECYEEDRFLHVRLKSGIIFKKMGDVWITPRDEKYWAARIYGISSDPSILKRFGYEGGIDARLLECFAVKLQLAEKFGYDHITGHHVDLNPFFSHNAFPKVIWAFSALKNAVLATDRSHLVYFMESFSAYTEATPFHEIVCEPVDAFSERFVMRVPRVMVAYMSFHGNNQEDCIVVRDDLKAFDCNRVFTIRLKFKFSNGFPEDRVVFRPVVGDPDDEFLGTVVCHSKNPDCALEAIAQSIHVKCMQKNPRELDLFFNKPGFRVLEYDVTNERLAVCIERFHRSGTGDKLCSFYGQKGVIRKWDKMPVFDETVIPDLIVNPYCLFRMTPGQILEGVAMGGGRDARVVRNSEGETIPDASVFYAKTFYFPIAYWSSEHIYAPTKCVVDKIIGQAVKGRSRKGGMRLGNMELLNGMRGNGIASCFEEKFVEHGDGLMTDDGIMMPKSVKLCVEDAKFFKCNIGMKNEACITEEE